LNSNSNVLKDKAVKELGFSSRPLNVSLKDAYEWFMENYRAGRKFTKLSPNVSR